MIKRTSVIIAFILSLNSALFSQFRSIEVSYTFKSKIQGEIVTFYKTLLDDGVKSVFFDNDTTDMVYDKVKIIKKDSKKNKGFFYSKESDEGLYYAPIFGKDFYIKEDSLSKVFVWEFLPGKKNNILGYDCKVATCRFRGRTYIAYYSESIPYYSGPWKFMGLPGLILEISTDDEAFKYEAIKFVGLPNEVKVDKPYNKMDFLSFVQYKKLYLRKLADHQQKIKSEEKDEDVDINIKDTSMELLQ